MEKIKVNHDIEYTAGVWSSELVHIYEGTTIWNICRVGEFWISAYLWEDHDIEHAA